MSIANRHFEAQYEGRAHLLELMNNVDRLITGIPASGHASTELRENWNALVKTLAVEPEPEIRECPKCGAVGMLAATRCGNCWERLTPPAHSTSSSPEKPGGVTES